MKHLFIATAALALSFLGSCKPKTQMTEATDNDTIALTSVKFNADSAYVSIVKQCDFGPRVPNTAAHRQCGDWIVARFKSLGLEVIEQKADLKAWDGTVLKARNIIASYRPEATDRIVLAAHWDSRPWCDADPDTANHRKPVMAANDGASGVAVLLEIARLLPQLQTGVGIDFVCFDAEDYGAPYWGEEQSPQDGSDWCLGSRYWSQHPHKDGYKARYGILLDMVGGQDARYRYEGFSMRYARDIMLRLWDTAQRVGAGDLFLQEEGGYATDDHQPMNEIAGIPTVDVIPCLEGAHSFGVTWHTTNDTPEHISKKTLNGVGQSVLQMLSEEGV